MWDNLHIFSTNFQQVSTRPKTTCRRAKRGLESIKAPSIGKSEVKLRLKYRGPGRPRKTLTASKSRSKRWRMARKRQTNSTYLSSSKSRRREEHKKGKADNQSNEQTSTKAFSNKPTVRKVMTHVIYSSLFCFILSPSGLLSILQLSTHLKLECFAYSSAVRNNN